MICNWFKVKKKEVTPLQEEVKEEIIVRDFVKKIAEKMRDGCFSYKELFMSHNERGDGCTHRDLYWKDIKVSVWMGHIYLEVFGKDIPINTLEIETLGKEWDVLRDERVNIQVENQKIEETNAIKAAEEYFND